MSCNPVKYEARLDDGTVVSKSDGVEFTVQEGIFIKCDRDAACGNARVSLMNPINVMACLGHFCLALSTAVKTMKKGEKVLLTVKPQCKRSYQES